MEIQCNVGTNILGCLSYTGIPTSWTRSTFSESYAIQKSHAQAVMLLLTHHKKWQCAHAAFRVVFSTNYLKRRKRHPLTTALGSRKLGTIKLWYWLPIRRVSLHRWCHNMYLLQMSNIFPYKTSPHPLQGIHNFSRLAHLGWSFPCHKPASLLSCFRRFQQKHSPRLFLRKNTLLFPYSPWKILVTFPLRRQAPPGWLAETWTIPSHLKERQ